MTWLILIIVIVVAGVWQLRTHNSRPHKFGSLREEMDALRREIDRQRRP